MMIRSAIGIVLASALLAGCASTPHHEQVRTEAQARMDFIQAQMAFDQGNQAFRSGQFKRAMKQVDTAIARYPDQPPYHVLKGRIYLEMHNLESSMASFEEAIEIDPETAEAEYYRGIVFQRWSNFTRASDAYSRAYELDPQNVQFLLAAAETLISQGRYYEARELIEPKLKRFEHNPALRQLLGEIALLEGDPIAAAKIFSEVRLLSPDDTSLLEELARAQFVAQQFAQAHDSVKRLQELTDDVRPDLLHMEARCLVMMDRTKEARNVYLKLSQMVPSDPVIWIELGNVALEVGDLRRVALSAARTIALAPDRFEGYLFRGIYEQSQDRFDKAIAAFRESTEHSSENAWPHVLLGLALAQQGRDNEAQLAYGAALRIDPDHKRARILFHNAFATQPELNRP